MGTGPRGNATRHHFPTRTQLRGGWNIMAEVHSPPVAPFGAAPAVRQRFEDRANAVEYVRELFRLRGVAVTPAMEHRLWDQADVLVSHLVESRGYVSSRPRMAARLHHQEVVAPW